MSWKTDAEKRVSTAHKVWDMCLADNSISPVCRAQFKWRNILKTELASMLITKRSGFVAMRVQYYAIAVAWKWRKDGLTIWMHSSQHSHTDRTFRMVTARNQPNWTLACIPLSFKRRFIPGVSLSMLGVNSQLIDRLFRELDQDSNGKLRAYVERGILSVVNKVLHLNETSLPSFMQENPLQWRAPDDVHYFGETYNIVAANFVSLSIVLPKIHTDFGWASPPEGRSYGQLRSPRTLLQILDFFGFDIQLPKDIVDTIVMKKILNVESAVV